MGAGLEAGDKAPAQGPGPLMPILSLAVPHPTPFIQNDQAGPLGISWVLYQFTGESDFLTSLPLL